MESALLKKDTTTYQLKQAAPTIIKRINKTTIKAKPPP